MDLEALCDKSKNISIFCMFLSLAIVVSSQSYLLLHTETATARRVPHDIDHANQHDLNSLSVQKDLCTDHLQNNLQRPKTCSINSNWIRYVAVVGITLIEMFVDLPINLLLFFAIKYKKKGRIVPWLIFNSLRISAIVAFVCVLVICNIIGIDEFIGETDIVVSTYEDNHQYLDKRYMPK